MNSVHPTTVDTGMLNNPAMYQLFFPQLDNPTKEQAAEGFIHLNGQCAPWVDPVDVGNAVVYLASDEARHGTGTTHVIDAGGSAPYRIPHV